MISGELTNGQEFAGPQLAYRNTERFYGGGSMRRGMKIALVRGLR
jgi:hypothetical protein